MPASTAADLPELSNYEVEVLYDIVHRADHILQTDSSFTPFKALYTAYDAVLPVKGIDPDYDSKYVRYMFHIAEGGAPNEPFFSRFRAMLSKKGIEIEADSEGEGIEEVTRNFAYVVSGRNTPSLQEPPTPSRRASFSTFHDITAERARDADADETGQHTSPFGRRGSIDVPRSSASDLGTRRLSDSQYKSTLLSRLPIRGRLNRRAASDMPPTRRQRNASMSSRGSLRITRHGNYDFQENDYSADESEQPSCSLEDEQLAPLRPQYEPVEHYVPPTMLYRPSETQMLRDMETFEYHRIRIAARRILRKWRDRALELDEQHAQMDATATNYDRNILLKQAFDTWKASLLEKRRVAETERFFGHLETRAEKARDIFLLTKAFTHWAQSAEDEVQRTSVARRHILRTKYFNAWRDITAVNELKVRRHGLHKFLSIWRQRTASIHDDNYRAIVVHNQNVVQRTFQRWFFALAERQAPLWHLGRLKRMVFTKWAEIVRQIREREDMVEAVRRHDVQRKMMQQMKEKMADIRNLDPIAQDFRRIAALSLGFSTLKKQAQLVPKLREIIQRTDTGLIRSIFQTWRLRAQQSRQATQVDKKRIMRNCWTSWNDQLRIQVLAVQINDRVVLSALYKWTLAARVSVFQRVQNAETKQRFFKTWLTKTRTKQTTLENAERRFLALHRQKTLHACVDKLERATVARKDKEALALSVYEPKLLQSVFWKLEERHQHFSQLNTWAEDARFFVLTSSCIKRWREATQHAKRNRRREAYALVRRHYKVALVRNSFVIWRDKTRELEDKGRQAEAVAANRVLKGVGKLFTHWHTRTTTLVSLDAQAVQTYNSHLFTLSLSFLHQRHMELQTLTLQALALRRESQDVAASSCLRKLEWRLFQAKQQESNALALEQRNFEKHVRAMVRFWAERTNERVGGRGGPGSPTPVRRGSDHRNIRVDEDEEEGGDEGEDVDGEGIEGGEGDNDENDTRRLEAWTAFDEEGLGLSASNIDLSLHLPHRQPPHHSTTQSRRSHQQPNQQRNTPGLSRTIMTSPPPPPQDADLYDEPTPLEDLGIPFATSTPMPGYLRTPSKRSVARSKRLTHNVDFADASLHPRIAPIGAPASAPVSGFRNMVESVGAVRSFGERLRKSGFGSGGREGEERRGGVTGTPGGILGTLGVGRRGRGGNGRAVGFRDIVEEE
ncbi:Sfi1-domain-containing protein [Delitschia confertaspora ATCC 74209]|uniref:Sfi1-domain-containing protein n=1 Tax=Delitschia confertaspora ATCC 74209 TaxID=1513339 RepID=A0A9P4MUQ8_9PLEO|nr:Sfi1-domain-containing protein [Delitschia confertaspora ATCC 74209]